jgi:hypothetical protein
MQWPHIKGDILSPKGRAKLFEQKLELSCSFSFVSYPTLSKNHQSRNYFALCLSSSLSLYLTLYICVCVCSLFHVLCSVLSALCSLLSALSSLFSCLYGQECKKALRVQLIKSE